MITTKRVMVDEGSLMLAQQYSLDRVRLNLRNIPGIPNASYLTSDTRVFVFEKLVRLVIDADLDLKNDVARVLDLAAMAWVCPEEAVRVWGATPVGYRIEACEKDRGWQIRHDAFSGVVPLTFLSMTEAQTALSKMLMGSTVGDGGNMVCTGQPLILAQDAMPDLGTMPNLPLPGLKATVQHGWLKHAAWLAGHSLIDRSVYDQTCEAERQWREVIGQLDAFVNANHSDLLAIISKQRLIFEGDLPYPLDSDDEAEAQEMAELYPELVGTSTAWLWHKASDFSSAQGWRSLIKMRDDRFISFLLGMVAVPCCSHYAAEQVGISVAYFLLQGDDLDGAGKRAKELYNYSSNLSARSMYIQRAMQHIKHDAERKSRCEAIRVSRPVREVGQQIHTLNDYLAEGRKYSVARVVVGSESLAAKTG